MTDNNQGWWEDEFDKLMKPPKFLKEMEGRDCVMCGHPTPNSRGAELLKSFISRVAAYSHAKGVSKGLSKAREAVAAIKIYPGHEREGIDEIKDTIQDLV